MLIATTTDLTILVTVILAVVLGLLSFHTGLVLAVATVALGITRLLCVLGMIVPLVYLIRDPSLTGEYGQIVAGVVVASAIGLFQTALLAALVKRSRQMPAASAHRRRRR